MIDIRKGLFVNVCVLYQYFYVVLLVLFVIELLHAVELLILPFVPFHAVFESDIRELI